MDTATATHGTSWHTQAASSIVGSHTDDFLATSLDDSSLSFVTENHAEVQKLLSSRNLKKKGLPVLRRKEFLGTCALFVLCAFAAYRLAAFKGGDQFKLQADEGAWPLASPAAAAARKSAARSAVVVGMPLYSGPVDLRKVHEAVQNVDLDALIDLEGDAAELTSQLGTPEASAAFLRLRRLTKQAQEKAKQIHTSRYDLRKASMAVAVAQTTRARGALDDLRLLYAAAAAEADRFFSLSQQTLTDAAAEAERLICSIHSQQQRLEQLEHGLKGIIAGYTSNGVSSNLLEPHLVAMQRLLEAAGRDQEILLSASINLHRDRGDGSSVSLVESVEAVRVVSAIQRRLRRAAAEADHWSQEAEEVARAQAQNAFTGFYAHLLWQRNRVEVNKFACAYDPSQERHQADRQQLEALSRRMLELTEHFGREQKLLQGTADALQMFSSVRQARNQVRTASEEVSRVATVSTGVKALEALRNVAENTPPDSSEAKARDEAAKELISQLEQTASEAVDAVRCLFENGVRIKGPGRNFIEAAEAPPRSQHSRNEVGEKPPSHGLSRKWSSDAEAATVVKLAAEKTLEQLREPDLDALKAIATADECAYLVATAISRDAKATRKAAEGNAWMRLEAYVEEATSAHRHALASMHAPSEQILQENNVSSGDVVRLAADVYRQQRVGQAAKATADLQEKVWQTEMLVENARRAKRQTRGKRPVTVTEPLTLATAQQEALRHAGDAYIIVERSGAMLAALTERMMRWPTTEGMHAVEQAHEAARKVRDTIQTASEEFNEGWKLLQQADTKAKLVAAVVAILQAKEAAVEAVRQLHFTYQSTALTVLTQLPAVIMSKGDEKGNRNSGVHVTSEIEAALRLARDAQEAHIEVTKRLQQDLQKLPRSHVGWRGGEDDLRDEAILVQSFISRIAALAAEARQKMQAEESVGHLASEARECAMEVVQAVVNADTQVYDLQNSLDMAGLLGLAREEIQEVLVR
ncbi:hypothetical protein, conserved [Eimeria tenella]|uniref:Uncharacterized protein n=1 Tax=Eimeria tenella TaxID=5802 RepID=U6KRF6_EIMTE|nr:hypothetical protein, conserved [Eimeria tenella]CDJ38924.1 hypothetical protein, conserved [Eimeria tenella]|eukprot:XP_013229679.1 hypothetical protein, conserved [Eimeria tenella]